MEQDIKKENEECCGDCCSNISKKGSCTPSGAVYGMGFIGAVIYFIQHADTFWTGVVGVLKAIVWPAILVYKLIELLSK